MYSKVQFRIMTYNGHDNGRNDNENFASIDFLRKPIFNNTEIPVPHCSETYPAQPLVGEVCNVNEVFLLCDYDYIL